VQPALQGLAAPALPGLGDELLDMAPRLFLAGAAPEPGLLPPVIALGLRAGQAGVARQPRVERDGVAHGPGQMGEAPRRFGGGGHILPPLRRDHLRPQGLDHLHAHLGQPLQPRPMPPHDLLRLAGGGVLGVWWGHGHGTKQEHGSG
jgi:hypothetical protein